MKTVRIIFVGLVPLVALSFPIVVGQRGPNPEARTHLQQIGLAYSSFCEQKKRGPKDVDELRPYIDGKEAQEGLRDGDYIFLWNVSQIAMRGNTSTSILAYQKQVPEKGGYVLFGDGYITNISGEAFRTTKLAEAKPAADGAASFKPNIAELMEYSKIQNAAFTYMSEAGAFESFLNEGASGSWVPFAGSKWRFGCRRIAYSISPGRDVVQDGKDGATYYRSLLDKAATGQTGLLEAVDAYHVSKQGIKYNPDLIQKNVSTAKTTVNVIQIILQVVIAVLCLSAVIVGVRWLRQKRKPNPHLRPK